MAGASALDMTIFSFEPIVKLGTGEQKRRILVLLINRKEPGCFGVSEPSTGLDTLCHNPQRLSMAVIIFLKDPKFGSQPLTSRRRPFYWHGLLVCIKLTSHRKGFL
jgi:hypothetical protein